MAARKYLFLSISASRSLAIMILVSKHTYIGAGILTELFLNYRADSDFIHGLNGSHFPKWPPGNIYFWISQPLDHLQSWCWCLNIHIKGLGFQLNYFWATGPSQFRFIPSMTAIFQKMAARKCIFFNIAASRSLAIMILVFKHTYLGTGISTKLFLSYTAKSVSIYTLNGSLFKKKLPPGNV